MCLTEKQRYSAKSSTDKSLQLFQGFEVFFYFPKVILVNRTHSSLVFPGLLFNMHADTTKNANQHLLQIS